MTSSVEPFKLIKISEAKNNSEQRVVFCIPINNYEAARINDLRDISVFFRGGFVSKIVEEGITKQIDFKLKRNGFSDEYFFEAYVAEHKIQFFISDDNWDGEAINIRYEYGGNDEYDLSDKKFFIIEPVWRQLDELFLNKRIFLKDFY